MKISKILTATSFVLIAGTAFANGPGFNPGFNPGFHPGAECNSCDNDNVITLDQSMDSAVTSTLNVDFGDVDDDPITSRAIANDINSLFAGDAEVTVNQRFSADVISTVTIEANRYDGDFKAYNTAFGNKATVSTESTCRSGGCANLDLEITQDFAEAPAAVQPDVPVNVPVDPVATTTITIDGEVSGDFVAENFAGQNFFTSTNPLGNTEGKVTQRGDSVVTSNLTVNVGSVTGETTITSSASGNTININNSRPKS